MSVLMGEVWRVDGLLYARADYALVTVRKADLWSLHLKLEIFQLGLIP